MTKSAGAFVIAVIVAMLSGCGTQATQEEVPTTAKVGQGLINGLLDKQITVEIQVETGAPDSLFSGPCDSYSDEGRAIENLLTDEELDFLCNCTQAFYELKQGDVRYDADLGVITIETGKPSECVS
jgi:hypothetical protein